MPAGRSGRLPDRLARRLPLRRPDPYAREGPVMIDTPVSDGNRQQLTTNPSGEPTLTQLVSGITDDAQRLMVQQYQMLRAELKEDLRRTKSALAYLSVGIVASLIGVLFLV